MVISARNKKTCQHTQIITYRILHTSSIKNLNLASESSEYLEQSTLLKVYVCVLLKTVHVVSQKCPKVYKNLTDIPITVLPVEYEMSLDKLILYTLEH